MKVRAPVVVLMVAGMAVACDKGPAATGGPEASATASVAAATTTGAAPEPPRAPTPSFAGAEAPDIVVDPTNVSVGNAHVATGEPGLAGKIAALVAGKPMIAGQMVSVVAMRNAKPSLVAMTLQALRGAKATGAVVKTEARDGSTQKLPVAFVTSVPDCAVVAWIAKDAVTDVWPAGGGAVKRVGKGLAGPDMTLGLDAMRAAWNGCSASQIVVGADDSLPWGLVFDLGTSALQAPGARADSAVLVTSATPGRKLSLD